MAALNPPAYIQASSHPADGFRRALKALRESTGVVLTGDLAVVQNGTPNMSVNVAAGTAVIDGTENSVTQGSYICTNDAVVNLAIAASDPTNPRNDLIVAKVQDAAYSGATNLWSLAVVTGTPAGSPVDPATPLNAIILARVRVNATVTTIVNANITDLRPFVHGSISPGAGGFTLWDSTGALKNAVWTDAGVMALRNALQLPSSVGAALPTTAYGTVPVKIDDQLLGAPAASITFVNPLPTGFRHLLIEWYARGDTAAVSTNLNLRFNNISTATYDYETLRGNSATASAFDAQAQTAATLGGIPASTATANYFGTGQARIFHYQGTVGNKVVISNSTYFTSDAAGGDFAESWNNKWRTTGTAITRIDLLAAAGNFIAGSLFTLWGIP